LLCLRTRRSSLRRDQPKMKATHSTLVCLNRREAVLALEQVEGFSFLHSLPKAYKAGQGGNQRGGEIVLSQR